MQRFSWRHRDHTQGNLLTSLLVLALPSMGTSVAGAAAYQLMDLKFLSWLGAVPQAAVILTNQTLRQVGFLLVLGASLGAQALIARSVGEGRTEQAEHMAGQVLLVGGVFCLLFAIAGGFFPRELMSWVAHDSAVLEAGIPYVRLAFILMFGFILIPLFGSILSGAGDATTPMLITVLATPVSLFAEWILIFGHWGAPALGVEGVALGATCGSLVGVALSLWALLSGRCRIHLRPRHLLPDAAAITQLLRFSWQPALHLAGRTLIILYFMTLAGRFGAEVQAAFGIGIRLELVVVVIIFPIANACATLVGQNLGAGSRRRAWRTVAVGMAAATATCLPFCLSFFWFGEPLVATFSDDPAVIRVGAEYLVYVSAALLLMGPYFVAFRALQGAGEMTAPMLISNGVALCVGLPLGHYLALETDLGPTGLWIAMLANLLTNTTCTLIWLARGSWTRRQIPSFAGSDPGV